MTLIDFAFPKLRTRKTLSDKCLKGHISEDPSTSNIVIVQKNCWNLRQTPLIIFINNCHDKCVGKSLSY